NLIKRGAGEGIHIRACMVCGHVRMGTGNALESDEIIWIGCIHDSIWPFVTLIYAKLLVFWAFFATLYKIEEYRIFMAKVKTMDANNAWSKNSWVGLPIRQQPEYDDKPALENVLG